MSARAGQELAEDKLTAIRETFRDVAGRVQSCRHTYEQSSALMKKSRELIKRSNEMVGRHRLRELYRL